MDEVLADDRIDRSGSFSSGVLWQWHLIQLRESSIHGTIRANNPVPVVFIVFDEFSGTTLFDEKMEIDGQRFPQIARLAGMSTWYRNATTVSLRTDAAVPAIISGRFPVTPRPPLAANYPGNLFQVIEATEEFEMAVFEPVSRICSRSIGPFLRIDRTFVQKCGHLLLSVATVYPRLILTDDTPVPFPKIPVEWFGVSPIQLTGWEDFTNFTSGRFNYPGQEHRKRQYEHFLKCIGSSERPGFYFLHTILPHYPWTFLPSGEQYLSEFVAPPFPSAARGELGEDWDNDRAAVVRNEYRYRLQLGYTDRFIGEVLDRLEETDLLSRCLLIVTADHGVSFRPGHSRRLPDGENLPEILSVPLFIKLPGESTGHIDDRNVETVDLFPTVAEVLGIDLPEPVDGIAVSNNVRRPRKTFYYESKMTIVEPDFPQRISSAKRQFDIYGNSPLEQLPAFAASHPDWRGRAVESFDIGKNSIPVMIPEVSAREDKLKIARTCFISGWFDTRDLPESPAEIVLVADGVVRDTSRTTINSDRKQSFQFLVPEWVTEGPPKTVQLYVVDPKRSPPRLIPLMRQIPVKKY